VVCIWSRCSVGGKLKWARRLEKKRNNQGDDGDGRKLNDNGLNFGVSKKNQQGHMVSDFELT
jgi:hypothetical protein